VQPAQGANRRAALRWADQRFFPAGIAVLESRQQRIVGRELIDAAATLGTVGEVGTDVDQFLLGELAQRQCTQRFLTRMIQHGLAHDKPVRDSSEGQTTMPLLSKESVKGRKT
jgi:hypothetical protein